LGSAAGLKWIKECHQREIMLQAEDDSMDASTITSFKPAASYNCPLFGPICLMMKLRKLLSAKEAMRSFTTSIKESHTSRILSAINKHRRRIL